MVKRGKNINMFLMDGEVTGKIKCTLSNWTGVIYKIPRIQLGDLKSRSEMKQSGVYFLLGRDDANQQDTVYIGQATSRKNGEGVLLRVQEHTRDNHADYFNDVIVLTTQNNSFGPTEISYLENRFTQLANEANRFVVRNGNEPNSGNVTEEKQSELDEVVENTKTIIGTLGYRVFVPMINGDNSVDEEPIEAETVLALKRKIKRSNREIIATCRQTAEGFVVLEGSMIELTDGKGIPESIRNLRQELLKEGIIKDGILKKNRFFNSPSYAASFVLGMPTNGRTDWKDSNGCTLKEREENL